MTRLKPCGLDPVLVDARSTLAGSGNVLRAAGLPGSHRVSPVSSGGCWCRFVVRGNPV
jgi:hypothetical protein